MPDETAIQDYVSEASLERGEDYYRRGAVLDLVMAGSHLFASVRGSEYSPYRVCIRLEEESPKSASCSCPYDWGGYCKHIVAAFLTYARGPNELKTTTALRELLASMDADELRNLLIRFIERNPRMIFLLEGVACTSDFNFLIEDPEDFPYEYDSYDNDPYDYDRYR